MLSFARFPENLKDIQNPGLRWIQFSSKSTSKNALCCPLWLRGARGLPSFPEPSDSSVTPSPVGGLTNPLTLSEENDIQEEKGNNRVSRVWGREKAWSANCRFIYCQEECL